MIRSGQFSDSSRPPRNALAWLTAAALLFFLTAGLLFIGSQGLHEDEGQMGVHALENLARLTHPDCEPWRLMESYYVGTLNSFLPVPTIALLGPTSLALRLPHVFLALAGMGLMFLVLCRLFQTSTALLTVCLLAVNSTWIRSVRLGEYREEILQIFFFWLILALLTLPRRPRWATAAFAAGLALWAKIMFLGYLAGLAAAVMIFGPPGKDTGAPPGRGNWRTVPAAGLAFLTGLSPLLYWNHSNGWETFQQLLRAAGRTQDPTNLCDNAHVYSSLLERISHVLQLLTSQIPLLDLDGVDNPLANRLYLALFLAASGGIAAFLASRTTPPLLKRRLGFVLTVYGVLFLCTCFAPVARYAGHETILLPLPEILIAFCFCQVLAPPASAARLRPLVAAGLLAHAGTEAFITARVLDRIHRGQVDQYVLSPAMFPVARTLLDQHARILLTLCNDLGDNIGYLCGGKVQTEYVCHPVRRPTPISPQAVRDFPMPVFLLQVDGKCPSGDIPRWFASLRESGLSVELFRTFASPGQVFSLYRITRPEGPAEANAGGPADTKPRPALRT